MYPISIEPLDTTTEIDEIGFTKYEKVALRQAWKIIETEIPYHSEQVFFIFFSKYPKYITKFQKYGRKDDNEILHMHPLWVLESLGRLIEQGLEDTSKFNKIIMELVKRHEKRGLSGKDILCMTDTLKKHLSTAFSRQMTVTLKNAIDKLLKHIVQGYK